MNTYFLLLTETFFSILLSLIVLYILSNPLKNVLCKVCPDDQAANFWLSYIKVVLLIVPLLLVLIMDVVTQFSDPVISFRFAFIAILGGLLAALFAVGQRLGKFVITPQQLKVKS